MSEEVKEEVVKEGAKEETKEDKEDKGESKEETKEVEETKEALGFSPFIKESDRFNVKVKCYEGEDEGDLMVKGVDFEFDNERTDIKEIEFIFKHASQGDFNIISSQAGSFMNEDDSPDNFNLNRLEFARLLVLIREWSLPEEVTNANIVDLNPKIVKAVVYKLREKISLEGIF